MRAWFIFLRKELAVEGRHGMPIIQSLILTPLISALPLFLIYRRTYAQDNLAASWNGHSYQSEMWVGFVCHFCLNSGCYVFFNRLMSEWSQNTFALLWFAPRHRLMSMMTLSVTDILRVVLFSVTFSLLFLYGQTTLIPFLLVLLHFFGFFLLGAALGMIRMFLRILFPASLDLVFYLYLGLLLSSGFYFPTRFLPEQFQLLVQANPFVHGKIAVLGVMGGSFAVASGLQFWGSLALVWLVAIWLTGAVSVPLSEKALRA